LCPPQERPAIESSKKKRGKQKCVVREADAAEIANDGRNTSKTKNGNAQKSKPRVVLPAGAASDEEEVAQHEGRPETLPRDGYKGGGEKVDKEKEAMARELQELKRERTLGEDRIRRDLLQQQQLWEREREAMRDEILCVVCLDGPKDTALSCGHQACARCAKALEICHICRQKITLRTRLY
jgi:hypothetical protein